MNGFGDSRGVTVDVVYKKQTFFLEVLKFLINPKKLKCFLTKRQEA